MPDPILAHAAPDAEILQRVGSVASEWSHVEMLLSEMLTHFVNADAGAMYVITQKVASASVIGWIRTLAEIQIKNADALNVISDLLTEVDAAREDRNTVVHGVWTAHSDPGFAFCQTFRWERSEVAITQLWSTADLDDVITRITLAQRMLANFGIRAGYLKTQSLS